VIVLVVWLHNKMHFSVTKTFSILCSVSASFLSLITVLKEPAGNVTGLRLASVSRNLAKFFVSKILLPT
jgi:hypothetical protein